MSTTKPHKGTINNWSKCKFDKELIQGRYPDFNGLGYLITGTCINHPDFGTCNSFSTSWVVKRRGNEIETRNSRYTLGTPLEKIHE